MIEFIKDFLLDQPEICNQICLHTDNTDQNELARIIAFVKQNNMKCISVLNKVIPIVWTWTEYDKLNIMSRFELQDVNDYQLSAIISQMTDSFKNGANGTQIFIKFSKFALFVDSLLSVKDDLFFNRELSIGFDITDIEPSDYDLMFDLLIKIQADSVVFRYVDDTENKSDFVGRITGILSSWNNNFKGSINLMCGHNFLRIEQTFRLIKNIKSDLLSQAKFFIKI